MDFKEIVEKRFSERRFDENKEVEKEKIEAILNINKLVPTAKNKQPQRIYVIKSKEGIEKLKKRATFYGAPVVFMVCTDDNITTSLEYDPEYTTADTDASIVGTYMMLEATNQGLNTIWLRWYNVKELREEFDLEENITPRLLLAVGYPREDSKPAHLHYERKEIEEITKYL